MESGSPLEHSELRDIERSLDEGDNDYAAASLALLINSRHHVHAIDFLTTRLLFQRGRIDEDGAADRLTALLTVSGAFPEAERWLAELEGLTEPNTFVGSREDCEIPTQPGGEPASPEVARQARALRTLQRFDEEDDDVTPAQPLEPLYEAPRRAAPLDAESLAPEDFAPDSSEPPPRPDDTVRSARPSRPAARMPFDSLAAKEQLSAAAGRYRESLHPPAIGTSGRRQEWTAPPLSLVHFEQAVEAALEEARAGDTLRARQLLPPPPTPEGLGADVRATLARLLLEVGDSERAAHEAVAAFDAAPDSTEAGLLFAWCAVRYARQRDDAWNLERAQQTLKRLRPGPAPEAGLLEALRACVEARVGSPSVALGLAQRALRVNAESVDALAALAEAAALAGDGAKAEAALEGLLSVATSAAEQLAPRLQRLGVGENAPTSSASVWPPLEHALYSGARDSVREAVEALALQEVGLLSLSSWDESVHAMDKGIRFLSLAPVLRHFGPYDASLASLPRLEAGLGALYGLGPRASAPDDPARALWQVAGLYLGTTLQKSCRGSWIGNPDDLVNACVSVLGDDVAPFQIVRNRISHGKHATIPAALGSITSDAPRVAQLHRSTPDCGLSLPWGTSQWPSLEQVPRLGRALGHSVVAAYCRDRGGATLDRSLASLPGLNDYLSLVTSEDAPLGGDNDWARWLSVLIGGYCGEVLCREMGATWCDTQDSGAAAFGVTVGLKTLTPVATVLASLAESPRTSLSELFDTPHAPPRRR